MSQRLQVLSAFIAVGNTAAARQRHFFSSHLPCLWLDSLHGRLQSLRSMRKNLGFAPLDLHCLPGWLTTPSTPSPLSPPLHSSLTRSIFSRSLKSPVVFYNPIMATIGFLWSPFRAVWLSYYNQLWTKQLSWLSPWRRLSHTEETQRRGENRAKDEGNPNMTPTICPNIRKLCRTL